MDKALYFELLSDGNIACKLKLFTKINTCLLSISDICRLYFNHIEVDKILINNIPIKNIINDIILKLNLEEMHLITKDTIKITLLLSHLFTNNNNYWIH